MQLPLRYTLFPYTTLFRSALEPVGAVPDLTRLPRGSAGAALYNVERSLGSILRSEEHTSELQSRFDLVCRLLLEKKKHSVVRLKQLLCGHSTCASVLGRET